MEADPYQGSDADADVEEMDIADRYPSSNTEPFVRS
jgi:hypothetical protein